MNAARAKHCSHPLVQFDDAQRSPTHAAAPRLVSHSQILPAVACKHAIRPLQGAREPGNCRYPHFGEGLWAHLAGSILRPRCWVNLLKPLWWQHRTRPNT
jgi:hypothetical protein